MLQFTFIRSTNLAMVDNADIIIDCSTLPANVEIVAFAGIEGKIEYNDRPAMRTPFTDPSPYQLQLNAWMTAYAAVTPALLLAQAKQVKRDLVDSIFHHKRRLPYASGPWQYDARDEAVAYGTALLGGMKSASTNFFTQINQILATLVGQFNNNVIGAYNSTVSSFGVGITANCLNALLKGSGVYDTDSGGVGSVIGYVASTKTPNFAVSGMTGMANLPGATMPASSISIAVSGNIVMQPLNASAPQSIAATDFYSALVNIAGRRSALNTNRLTKQNAINALTTIPAVVAYDATTGWSF